MGWNGRQKRRTDRIKVKVLCWRAWYRTRRSLMVCWFLLGYLVDGKKSRMKKWSRRARKEVNGSGFLAHHSTENGTEGDEREDKFSKISTQRNMPSASSLSAVLLPVHCYRCHCSTEFSIVQSIHIWIRWWIAECQIVRTSDAYKNTLNIIQTETVWTKKKKQWVGRKSKQEMALKKRKWANCWVKIQFAHRLVMVHLLLLSIDLVLRWVWQIWEYW